MDLETSKGKACEQTIYNNRLSIGQNGSVMGTVQETVTRALQSCSEIDKYSHILVMRRPETLS